MSTGYGLRKKKKFGNYW